MKLEVKDQSTWTQPVTVQVGYWEDEDFVAEECNHAGAESVELDFGYPDPIKADYVDDWRWVMMCDKCNKVETDGIWE